MKEVTITRYQANDGTLFNTPEECRYYENGGEVDHYKDVENYVKEMEIQLLQKPKLVPLEYYVLHKGLDKEMYHRLKAGHFRYFQLLSDQDAEILAQYLVLTHQRENRYILTEEFDVDDVMAKFKAKKYPCVCFISDLDHGYHDRINTFESEIQLIEKYCKHNGYEMNLTPKAKE